MSNGPEQPPREAEPSPLANLDPDSYTALRLHHSTPSHLQATSRRLFIGPIPEGWLKAHRRDWYKHHLRLGGYSTRQATFRPSHELTWTRRLSGIEQAPREHHRQSFPQPQELEDEDNTYNDPDEARTSQVDGAVESRPEQEEHELEGRAIEGGSATKTVVPNRPIGKISNSGNADDASRRFIQPLDRSETIQPLLEPLNHTESKNGSHSLDNSYSTALTRQRSTDALGVSLGSPRTQTLEETNDINSPSLDNRLSLVASSPVTDRLEPSTSTSALIPGKSQTESTDENVRPGSSAKKILDKVKTSISKPAEVSAEAAKLSPDENDEHWEDDGTRRTSHVHFLPQDNRLLLKARKTQGALLNRSKDLLKRGVADGQIVKMEKMLVRIDATTETKLPSDYDENCSQGIISRVEERWREYMVVCRQNLTNPDAEFHPLCVQNTSHSSNRQFNAPHSRSLYDTAWQEDVRCQFIFCPGQNSCNMDPVPLRHQDIHFAATIMRKFSRMVHIPAQRSWLASLYRARNKRA